MTSIADAAERATAVDILLAEETRISMMVGVAVGWALADELGPPTDDPRTRGELTMDIRWLGHSCFELSDGDARVLDRPVPEAEQPDRAGHRRRGRADPHPAQPRSRRPRRRRGRRSRRAPGLPCVAIVELAKWLDARGVEETYDPNLGGVVEFDWGWVKLVQAFHTNTTPGEGDEPFSAETGTVDRPAGRAS